MATKKCEVPEKVLTPALLAKYESRIKARPVMKKNKHGGRAIELYIDDGVTADRKVEVELPDLSSTFGVGSMKSDQKTESGEPKESLSIAFPLRKNGPDLQAAVDIFDRIAKREVVQHWEKLSNGEKKSAEVLNERCQSCAKKPQKAESLEQYGTNFKIGIYEKGVRYFTNGKEVQREDLMQKDDQGRLLLGVDGKPRGKPGRYTVRFEVPRIYFMAGNVYGMVFKMKRMLYEPEAEDDELFVTKSVGGKAKSEEESMNPAGDASCDGSSSTDGATGSGTTSTASAPTAPSASADSSNSSGAAAASAPAPAATVTAPTSAPVSTSPPGGMPLEAAAGADESSEDAKKRKGSPSAGENNKASKRHKA